MIALVMALLSVTAVVTNAVHETCVKNSIGQCVQLDNVKLGERK